MVETRLCMHFDRARGSMCSAPFQVDGSKMFAPRECEPCRAIPTVRYALAVVRRDGSIGSGWRFDSSDVRPPAESVRVWMDLARQSQPGNPPVRFIVTIGRHTARSGWRQRRVYIENK